MTGLGEAAKRDPSRSALERLEVLASIQGELQVTCLDTS